MSLASVGAMPTPFTRSAPSLPSNGATINGSHTYQERRRTKNLGEQLFEKYCNDKHYTVVRLGFDSEKDPIKEFFKINPLLRNIPDYLVETEKGLFVVQVKGTANIKKKEVEIIPLFLEWYGSKEAPLVYAFCFAERPPVIMYAEKVIELYKNSVDKVWKDGVVYRTLVV
jgi:hypothetical protein